MSVPSEIPLNLPCEAVSLAGLVFHLISRVNPSTQKILELVRSPQGGERRDRVKLIFSSRIRKRARKTHSK